MTAIETTVKNGRIVVDAPADWPEGSRVIVERAPAHHELGMTEEEQGDDPQSIARWLAEFDAIPPLRMTPEEEAEWRAARQAQKEYEIANWEERSRRIEGLFP